MPHAPHPYFLYIMANRNGSLYIGVTGDLMRRVWEHRTGGVPGHTATYHLTRLVYVEECGSVTDALAREKQLKGWRREKKLALIVAHNPAWRDLAEEAFGPAP